MAIQSKTTIPPFDAQQLEAIAKVLGNTDTGLTGLQIEYLLKDANIPDTDPSNTKWRRLCNAFIAFQNEHQAGNHVIIFINRAMNPVSYTGNADQFESKRLELNQVLAMCGFELSKNGKVKTASKAQTLDEALARANKLQETLRQRKVHPDVLKYCNAEVLQENYFHAVLESMKSITAKIRGLSGIDADGSELVDRAFGSGIPTLAINAFDTKTKQGEQRGFMNLLKGLYGTVRNPLAHEPKIEWDEMTEQDAADIMTTISLIHRKLDKTNRASTDNTEASE